MALGGCARLLDATVSWVQLPAQAHVSSMTTNTYLNALGVGFSISRIIIVATSLVCWAVHKAVCIVSGSE